MGNTLTSASVSAADVIMPIQHSNNQQLSKSITYESEKFQNVPPPECPMHTKTSQQSSKISMSECPIDHMNKDEINPLNMVCIMHSIH